MNSKFILGGIASIAVSGLLCRYFRNKKKKIILTKRLEEYLADIQNRLNNLAGENSSIELIAYIVNCFEEIEDYLYLQDNSSNEQKRVQYLTTDKQKYEDAVFETIRIHDFYMEKARDIIEKRLGVSMRNIREFMHNNTTDQSQMAACLKQCRKAYTDEDIPEIDRENLKKAYITWAKLSIAHSKVSKQMFEASKTNPIYEALAYESLIVNKYLLRDKITGEFNFEEKYFEALITKHQLTEDSEIKEINGELKNNEF